MKSDDDTVEADATLFELIEALSERYKAGEPIDLDALRGRWPRHAREIEDAYRVLVYLQGRGGQDTDDGTPPGVEPIRIPDRIGPYAIFREVGRGGMGIVYEAWQPGAERRVALKVLPAASALDARQRRRFEREVRAAAQLRHEHIVPIYQVDLDAESPYFAMPLIEGGSLAELLADARRGLAADPGPAAPPVTRGPSPLTAALLRGRLGIPKGERTAATGPATDPERTTADFRRDPVPPLGDDEANADPIPAELPATLGTEYVLAVARLGLQAAEALEHAHEHDVVHRDVKPGNLLLDFDGRLWVADFGLARIRSDRTLSHALLVAGTLHYMSPEQASPDERPIDHRTDIYSLGVTLHELLTWRKAVSGTEVGRVLSRILHDEPVPVRRLNRAVPRDLELIVSRAMAKDPADRFATAGLLADQLRRFLEGRPATIRPPSRRNRLGRWAARHRVGLVASAASIGVLLAIAVSGLIARNVALSNEIEGEARRFVEAEGRLDALRQLASRAILDAEQLAEAAPPGDERMHAYYAGLLELMERTVDRLPDARRDRTLRHGAAVAHLHLSRCVLARGDRPEGLRRLDRSIAMLFPLIAEDPGCARYRVDLVRALRDRAFAHRDGGDADRAETDAFESLRVAKTVIRDFPDELERCNLRVDAHCSLAEVLHARGDGRSEAERHALIALRLGDALAEEHPGRPTVLANVRRALVLLSAIADRAGRLDDAERLARDALRIDDRLVALDPDDVDFAFDRTADLKALACLLLRSGRPAEAFPPLRHALEVCRSLAESFPGRTPYRARAIELLCELDAAFRMLGLPDAAASARVDALCRLGPMLAARPDDPGLRSIRDRLGLRHASTAE